MFVLVGPPFYMVGFGLVASLVDIVVLQTSSGLSVLFLLCFAWSFTCLSASHQPAGEPAGHIVYLSPTYTPRHKLYIYYLTFILLELLCFPLCHLLGLISHSLLTI